MIVKTSEEIWLENKPNDKWVLVDSLKKELEKLRKKKRSMNYMFFLYEKALNDLESVLFDEATTEEQEGVLSFAHKRKRESDKSNAELSVVAPKKRIKGR
jgi:hypothetical protein